eukprot:scaffold28014_cov45-Attheya_sp.AAC.3
MSAHEEFPRLVIICAWKRASYRKRSSPFVSNYEDTCLTSDTVAYSVATHANKSRASPLL